MDKTRTRHNRPEEELLSSTLDLNEHSKFRLTRFRLGHDLGFLMPDTCTATTMPYKLVYPAILRCHFLPPTRRLTKHKQRNEAKSAEEVEQERIFNFVQDYRRCEFGVSEPGDVPGVCRVP